MSKEITKEFRVVGVRFNSAHKAVQDEINLKLLQLRVY